MRIIPMFPYFQLVRRRHTRFSRQFIWANLTTEKRKINGKLNNRK